MNRWRLIDKNVFLILIIFFGLGFAFALPWLAGQQGSAADGTPAEPPHAANPANSPVYAEIVDHQRNSFPVGPPPDLCFATHNNGTTVFSSFNGSAVQQAVDDAPPGTTVKVAGTCWWVESRAGLSQTVYISQPLTLQGGYKKDEWDMEPDPENYTTTLFAQNLGRVVVISGTQDVTLNSLFIAGGLADDDTLSDNGGGIWSNSQMTLTNSIVYSNTARSGGGMYSKLGSPLAVFSSTFHENRALSGLAGGLYFSHISPTLSAVTFRENKADYDGGGLYNFEGNPTLINANFVGNSAGDWGGGFYNWDVGDSKIFSTTFSGNSAKYGGGLFNEYGSPEISKSKFVGNSAQESGGGLVNKESSLVMTNTLVSGNRAKNGGGIDSYQDNLTLINVTVSGNFAAEFGGGINNFDVDSQIINSIVWNNKDVSGIDRISENIYISGTPVSLTSSLVEGAYAGGSGWIGGSYVDGGGNIDQNPLFIDPVSPSSTPTTTGDLRLLEGSPAIDIGANDFVLDVPTDLDGEPRIADGSCRGSAVVDMGAYEYQRDMCYQRVCPLVVR
jgi:hypothetical protein